ncbi:LolA-like outer membrane lipoprotein chaperone [Hydrogenimonas sp.]
MLKIFITFTLALPLLATLPLPRYFRADFDQNVTGEGNRTLRYTGRLEAALPSHAKWRYDTPVKKLICLDGERAWVIEPELEQATLFRLSRAIPLAKILQKARKLAPRRYEAEYGGVTYSITTDDGGTLRTIAYTDDLGNRVVIAFHGVDTDAFDTATLRCDIPADYDIIDGRF